MTHPLSALMKKALSTTTIAAALGVTLFVGCGKSKPASSGRGDAAADGATTDGPMLSAVQQRGKYLVDAVVACGDCHTPVGPTGMFDMTRYLAGNPAFVELPNGDVLPSRNLTNDPTGLKNFTDDEIKTMITDGMRPSSAGMQALHPFMPYYVFKNMRAADLDAIVAYLRVVPAVESMIPNRSAVFDVPAPAPPLDVTKLPPISETFPERASALRGQYLAAHVGLCVECHTKHLPPGAASVLDEAHLFEGGEDFSALFASTLMIKPVSKNLTSDMTTGLGQWTRQEIVAALKEGKAKDGTGICPPMPAGPMAAYGQLTDADATDIANYLRSLPPKVNMIPDMCVFPPMAPAADGGAGVDARDGGAADTVVPAADGGVDRSGDGGVDVLPSVDGGVDVLGALDLRIDVLGVVDGGAGN